MAGRLSGMRALIVKVICVLVLGATVAGCDRCGDFFWKPGFQACKSDESPRPQ